MIISPSDGKTERRSPERPDNYHFIRVQWEGIERRVSSVEASVHAMREDIRQALDDERADKRRIQDQLVRDRDAQEQHLNSQSAVFNAAHAGTLDQLVALTRCVRLTIAGVVILGLIALIK